MILQLWASLKCSPGRSQAKSQVSALLHVEKPAGYSERIVCLNTGLAHIGVFNPSRFRQPARWAELLGSTWCGSDGRPLAASRPGGTRPEGGIRQQGSPSALPRKASGLWAHPQNAGSGQGPAGQPDPVRKHREILPAAWAATASPLSRGRLMSALKRKEKEKKATEEIKLV